MQEPDRDFTDLASRFGRAAAREIWKSLGKATRDLAKTIRALKLNADLCECDSVYFTSIRQSESASKRVRCAKSAGLPTPHDRGTLPHDRLARSGSHRHFGQRAGQPGSRVRGISSGCRPPRRQHFRAIARPRRQGVTVGRRSADGRRHHLGRVHRRGDRLRHAGISRAGRALPDEGHLRAGHQALIGPTPAARHGLGHRSTVSLPPMERRRAIAGRREDTRHRSPKGWPPLRRCRARTYWEDLRELADEARIPGRVVRGDPGGLHSGEHSLYPTHLFALGYGVTA